MRDVIAVADLTPAARAALLRRGRWRGTRSDLPTLRDLWREHVADPLGLWCEYEVSGLCRPRRFRADVLLRAERIVVELDGGVAWNPETGQRGAHGSIRGVENDIEKGNAYAVAGYTMLRFTRRMLEDGRARETVRLVLSHRRQGGQQ